MCRRPTASLILWPETGPMTMRQHRTDGTTISRTDTVANLRIISLPTECPLSKPSCCGVNIGSCRIMPTLLKCYLDLDRERTTRPGQSQKMISALSYKITDFRPNGLIE